ncbi:hypothetical protein IGK74_001099 [Enterococcus sp. AZ150]|uniref:BppU family phage baseplate upper protein n=1 Tax=Enterococcus sp. AZ150 TaxID=2774866 RepID=UPI003F215BA1
MAEVTHKLTLSVNEQNYGAGNFKVRQNDENTQLLDVQIIENGLPKSFEGLTPFFCVFPKGMTGHGVSEDIVLKFNAKNGTLQYIMGVNSMMYTGRTEAYFSFRTELKNGEWVEQFSTRSFFYHVEKSIYNVPIKDSNNFWTFTELYTKFKQYVSDSEKYGEEQKKNWEDFVEQNREIIESVDPGGKVLARQGVFDNFRKWDYSLIEKMANEFTERSVNASWFGILADGKTDDSQALQNLFDNLTDGENLIFPKNKLISIQNPVYIKKSNLVIDFNGSTLCYDSNNDLGDSNGKYRTTGALNINGNGKTDISTKVTSILQNQGAIDKKYYINGEKFNGLVNPYTKISRLSVENANGFSEGDLVAVNIRNYDSSWDIQFNDNPSTIKVIAKIAYIENNYIYVDFSTDLVFKDVLAFGEITKLDCISNVTIKNLNFIDRNETVIPEIKNITDKDRNSWVSGIHSEFIEGLKVANYTAKRIRNPSLMLSHVYNFNVSDVSVEYARIVAAGNGYAIQNISCKNGYIFNVYGNKLRHLIDFTSSGDVIVKKCYMPNDWHRSFDCHGVGEFNITFEDNIGRIILGNGVREFPCIIDNVKIVRQTGSVDCEWARSVSISDSTIYADAMSMFRCPNLVYENTKLIMRRTNLRFLGSTRGGIYTGSRINMINCEIQLNNEDNDDVPNEWDKLFYVIAYDFVKLDKIQTKNYHDVRMKIRIDKSTSMSITNSIMSNCGIFIGEAVVLDALGTVDALDLKNRILRITNCEFLDSKKDLIGEKSFISGSGYRDEGTINLIIHGNTFTAYRDNISWCRLLGNVTNFDISATENTITNQVLSSSFEANTKTKMFVSGNRDLTDAKKTDLDDYNQDVEVTIAANSNSASVVFPKEIYPKSRDYDIIIEQRYNDGKWFYGSSYISSKASSGFVLNIENTSTTPKKIILKVRPYNRF